MGVRDRPHTCNCEPAPGDAETTNDAGVIGPACEVLNATRKTQNAVGVLGTAELCSLGVSDAQANGYI